MFQALGNFIVVLNSNFIISFCLGDFDADGDLDLALTSLNSFRSDLHFYRNEGNGAFNLYASFNQSDGTLLRLGDLDSDGDLDIITPKSLIPFPDIAGLILFLNDGLGNFTNASTLFPNFCCPPYHGETISYWALTVNDYNNDGNTDISTGGSMSSLTFPCTCNLTQIFKNLGPGAFGIVDISPSIYSPYSISEDINGDGYVDLIESPGHLYINNNLTFSLSSYPGLGGNILTADFESDGDMDIAEQYSSGNKLNVYKNNSAGAFTSYSSKSTTFGGDGFSSGDFDSDGDIDIASSSGQVGRLAIFINGFSSSICSITGATNIPINSMDNLYISSVPSGFWNISNYNNTNASIASGQNNDSVKINAGSAGGHFVLYYNGPDSCGNLVILCTKHVFVDDPLPVELASFNSSINQRNVTLNWITASEENNSGFDIEQSNVKGQTSNDWKKIGFVQGHGTVTTSTNYTYEDRNLSSGKYKYRLKQMDYNGNFKYYDLQNEVVIGIPDKFSLSQNYPNPFNPKTKINYDIAKDGIVMIKIFDNSGREASMLVNEFRQAGYYAEEFNATNLSSGVYFYKLVAGSFVAVRKMVLLK